MGQPTFMSPWGKYPVYKDIARFEYGRLLWRNPSARKRLLAHWSNSEHPHEQRFLANPILIEAVFGLESRELATDERFKKTETQPPGRCEKIPPVFGST